MRNTIFFIIAFLAVSSLFANAQTPQKAKIKILHADMAIPGRDTLPTKLIGNVKLQHEDMIMNCDSLYQYDFKNYIEAFSNVHMLQNDTLNMWGDYATYDGNSQMAKVRNNVKLDDKSVTLTTDYLDYDAANKMGYYYNHGKIVDSINTLDSDFGYYYMPIKQMFFKKNVVVVSPEYKMVSDTMKYQTETKVISILGPTTIYGDNKTLYSEDGWYNSLLSHAELYKNNHLKFETYSGVADTIIADSTQDLIVMQRAISLFDSINNVLIQGNYGEMQHSTNYAFVTDSAILTMPGDPDSLFLHADTLTMRSLVKDSIETNIVDAFYKVRIYNKEIQGRCDSLSFTTQDSIIHLYNDPVVWANGNQLTAINIDLKLRNGMADQFFMKENAMIVNPMDTNIITIIDTTMFNQIKGREITGFLKNNELYQVFVDGSGETIYYPDDKGYPFALTNVTSSQIRIDLINRHINTITFISKPEGTMNPLFMVTPEQKFLRGYTWRQNERPKSKQDIFRVILPQTEEDKTETEKQGD